MAVNVTSQMFESYVPVFDYMPKDWEEAKPLLVEYLKKLSNAVNARTIGFLLDEELLSGQAFIPVAAVAGNSPQFRQVLRKVIDVSPLVAGANPPFAHGIVFDANFTLIDLWVSGTDTGTLTARRITGNDVIMDATNITITSPQAFSSAFAFVEYVQEK